MAYRTMKLMIAYNKAGKAVAKDKETLQAMADVHFRAGKLTQAQYDELTAEIAELER